MWIIHHSIIGLSTIHLTWRWRQKKLNVPLPPTKWRMDEAYIKCKGKGKMEWVTLYRAVDIMLSDRRNEKLATAFFKQAIEANGSPQKVVMDKIGAKLCPSGKILIPC